MKLVYIIFLFVIWNVEILASTPEENEKIKYRASFGNCPSRVAGALTLKLVKEFESKFSLRSVKKKIVNEKLSEKHFLSNYKIDYDPIQSFLQLQFECPIPLMKVQIYKESGSESYNAILVDNGELFDPTYEVMLKEEGKLSHQLPSLAMPLGDMDANLQQNITNLVGKMPVEFRQKISEAILGEDGDLTIILSVNGRPSSVFMGKEEWIDKGAKLFKIMDYMEEKGKIPAIINLTNAKKVVVKFSDKS